MSTRRTFIAGLGAAAAWPLAARGQQRSLPVIGFVSGREAEGSTAAYAAAFRKGLSSTGNVEGRNVAVEYHWLAGQYDRLPALMADLVQHRVAVIVTSGSIAATLAAKAATSTIPVVFSVGDDPVKNGLVVSLARPEANMTGINFFAQETTAKRLRLLHDLLPRAVHVAVLDNSTNAPASEPALRSLREAAPALGIQISRVLSASTIGEIDEAFAALSHERPDALFVAPDALLSSRYGQLATLATRDRLPTIHLVREFVAAGGLTAPVSPPAQSLEDWRTHMATVPPPSKGCFAASYPITEWHEVPCGPAPHRRHQPQRTNLRRAGRAAPLGAACCAYSRLTA